VANGPSVWSAFGAASFPDHASLPFVATKKVACISPFIPVSLPETSDKDAFEDILAHLLPGVFLPRSNLKFEDL
jgi:hypothetical protein